MTGYGRRKPPADLAGQIDRIIFMHERMGMTFTEIAAALGATKQGVAKAYHRHVVAQEDGRG